MAVNVTLVPAQIVLPEFEEMLTDAVTSNVTVMCMVLEVTLAGLAQASEDVITQVTSEPLGTVLIEKVLLLVPTLLPFIFH